MSHSECCEAVSLSQVRTALAVLDQIHCSDMVSQGYVYGATQSLQRAKERLEHNARVAATQKRSNANA